MTATRETGHMSTDTIEGIRADLASGKARLRLSKTEEAWYAETGMMGRSKTCVMSWSLGVDAVRADGGDDGTYGEWSFDWHSFQGTPPALKVCIYSESFIAFTASGLLDALPKIPRNATPDHVLALLNRLGFTDLTEREMEGVTA